MYVFKGGTNPRTVRFMTREGRWVLGHNFTIQTTAAVLDSGYFSRLARDSARAILVDTFSTRQTTPGSTREPSPETTLLVQNPA